MKMAAVAIAEHAKSMATPFASEKLNLIILRMGASAVIHELQMELIRSDKRSMSVVTLCKLLKQQQKALDALEGGKEMAKHRHEPNEATDMWRGYKDAQRARRRLRLPARTQEILDLAGKNFDVKALTDFQFRIDGKLDLYPTHRRYHDLKTGKRGGYISAIAIANVVLRGKREAVQA